MGVAASQRLDHCCNIGRLRGLVKEDDWWGPNPFRKEERWTYEWTISRPKIIYICKNFISNENNLFERKKEWILRIFKKV